MRRDKLSLQHHVFLTAGNREQNKISEDQLQSMQRYSNPSNLPNKPSWWKLLQLYCYLLLIFSCYGVAKVRFTISLFRDIESHSLKLLVLKYTYTIIVPIYNFCPGTAHCTTTTTSTPHEFEK